MKIQIEAVHEESEMRNLVEFATASGRGWGRWANETTPKVGEFWDVEMDLSAGLVPFKRENGQYSITVVDGLNHLMCFSESIDPDGLVYLRLSEDCLLMVEPGDGWRETGCWVTVIASADAIEITPIGTSFNKQRS